MYLIALTCGDIAEGERVLRQALVDAPTAGQGVVTDGTATGTRVLRRKFGGDGCDYVQAVEQYRSPGSVQSLFAEGLPLNGRVEGVFFEAHSHIRDIDGMHADEALDELCKVLYAKLFDEEQTAAGERAEPIRTARFGSSEELSATMRDLYRSAASYDERVFGLKIPGYKRSRGVFGQQLRLSSPALAKVWGAVERFDLSGSSTDIKGRAFQNVLGPAVRSGMGQYFTPEAVVAFMVEAANPKVNELMMDPFCGSGRFLSGCLRHVRAVVGPESRVLHEFAFGKLHGIEKSERMVRVAMTDMRLQGDGHSNVRCTDALLDFANYPDLAPGTVDLVLTNPPFGSLLGPEALAQLGRFDLARSGGSSPLEIIGLERCLQFLRPGGRLGIVVPEGLLGDRSKEQVREWIRRAAKLRGIVSLPISTFAPFGAAVKTSVLFLRKWKPDEEAREDYPIFVAQVDDVGHDSTGRPTSNAELPDVAAAFRAFVTEHGW